MPCYFTPIPHPVLFFLSLQPQNLVLMGEFPDCDVKLCDFEISRVLTPGREVREILGTPDYVGKLIGYLMLFVTFTFVINCVYMSRSVLMSMLGAF